MPSLLSIWGSDSSSELSSNSKAHTGEFQLDTESEESLDVPLLVDDSSDDESDPQIDSNNDILVHEHTPPNRLHIP